MLAFILRRLGTMALTMLCLTMIVFFMINLEPNLKKLAISQTRHANPGRSAGKLAGQERLPAEFLRPLRPVAGRGQEAAQHRPGHRQGGAALLLLRRTAASPYFGGILQGDFGCSTKFKTKVSAKLFPALGATGILMFWVMLVMVPISLLVGILAGMREGSRTDRALSVASIATTATPEYVSGVIFTVIFATWLGWLNGSAASATSAGHHLLQFHPAGDDDGDLRHRLHRPHDARLDGRGDDAAIYPHRPAEGPVASAASSSSTRCATR